MLQLHYHILMKNKLVTYWVCFLHCKSSITNGFFYSTFFFLVIVTTKICDGLMHSLSEWNWSTAGVAMEPSNGKKKRCYNASLSYLAVK